MERLTIAQIRAEYPDAPRAVTLRRACAMGTLTATKPGRDWLIDRADFEAWRDSPTAHKEGRKATNGGRKVKASDQIYRALKGAGIEHPSVFKGWHTSTRRTGWHYIKFGRSEAIWLGTSVREALEAIALRAEVRAEE